MIEIIEATHRLLLNRISEAIAEEKEKLSDAKSEEFAKEAPILLRILDLEEKRQRAIDKFEETKRNHNG